MLLANRANRFWDTMFNDPFFADVERTNTQVMKTDINEKDGNYIFNMELPGYKKEDIKVDLKDGYLTVSAQKEETDEEKDEKGNCVHKERFTGTCSRSFYVGEALKQEDIKAAYKDGVLTLTFPKEPEKIEEEPKLIEIE